MYQLNSIIHAHSTWSYDGKWPLEKIVSTCKMLGIEVVLMSEHENFFDEERWQNYKIACAEVSKNGCTVIPGIEYNDPENRVHILTWGNDHFLGNMLPTLELLKRAKENNCVTILAHPSNKGASDILSEEHFQLLTGIEVWNRKSDGLAISPEAMDILSHHEHLIPTFGIDFHSPKQLFPLINIIKTTSRTQESILESLRTRNIYAKAFGLSLSFWSSPPGNFAGRTLEIIRRRLLYSIRSIRGK